MSLPAADTDSPSTSGASPSQLSPSASSSPIGEVSANISGLVIAVVMIVVCGPRIFDSTVDIWIRRGLAGAIVLLALPARVSTSIIFTAGNVLGARFGRKDPP